MKNLKKEVKKDCAFRFKSGKIVIVMGYKTAIMNSLVKKLFPKAIRCDDAFYLGLGFSQQDVDFANTNKYWR